MSPMISESQKQKLIQYLDEARSKHMHMMYVAIGGTVLFMIPGLMVFRQITHHDIYAGGDRFSLYFAIWVICVVALVILFLTGYQRKFGSNAPIKRIQRNDFTCEYITVSQLSDIQGKPPYLLNDSLGTQFVVPVYLECKQMRLGQRVIGVYCGESRFAMLDLNQSTEF